MVCKISNFRLLIRDSDWLNFIHFSGYKYKIRLVSRLRKREDQALISISTILKFPALILEMNWSFQCLQSIQIFLKSLFPYLRTIADPHIYPSRGHNIQGRRSTVTKGRPCGQTHLHQIMINFMFFTQLLVNGTECYSDQYPFRKNLQTQM